ncbi:PAS domain-containing protein [Curvivirga aplysinae]|uniref:PAS domain-containing protein n=1 Tax=Curvivirga aplysinae TaxID=2529852 RepID=UPI001C3FAA3B|nr:PAS domain-containing protein [Curvivirga aplysinae]
MSIAMEEDFLQNVEDFHASANVFEVHAKSDLTLRCTKSIYNWWSSYKGNIPYKQDFQIINHLRHASNIYLAHRIANGVYKFVVCGEDVNTITGRETHNRTVKYRDIHENHEDNFNDLIRYYDQVLEKENCHFCVGNIHMLGKHTRGYESVDCPLLDKEGRANYILGAIQLT